MFSVEKRNAEDRTEYRIKRHRGREGEEGEAEIERLVRDTFGSDYTVVCGKELVFQKGGMGKKINYTLMIPALCLLEKSPISYVDAIHKATLAFKSLFAIQLIR